MKDEVGSCDAGLFVDGGEDGSELIALLDEFTEESRFDNPGLQKQVQPVSRFSELFERVPNLRRKFKAGSGAAGFAVVCPNGGAGTQNLTREHIRLARLGER